MSNNVQRTLPHSIEAEQYVLSSICIDGNETIARCLISKLGPSDFYEEKHRPIYIRAVALYHRNEPIEIGTIAEELRSAGELEQIGSYAFLTQISSRLPTTAQTPYFIRKVKEHAILRALIREHTSVVEQCYNFNGELSDLFEITRDRISKVEFGEDLSQSLRPALSFALPPEDDPTALIGRHRYLCRGDAALLVSSSGMGKSVMNYEWAVLASLGRPFLGIETKKPLKSLIVQSEDSDGDIGEVIFSITTALHLTEDEKARVAANVVIVTDRLNRGDAFVIRLRQLVDKVKPDLVWINPLHAFAGCDIADARELGTFLRAGLNGVNKDSAFAYMIVHHTPKPMTGKGVADRKWHEFMYDAAGSAELVNWARAVLTLKPTEKEGEFNLMLAKRGKRAGVMVPVHGEISRLELTTKIPCRHSSEQIKIAGRKYPFSILHWEGRDVDQPTESAEKKPGRGGQEQYEAGDFIVYFPESTTEGHTLSAISRYACEGNISKTTLHRWERKLIEAQLVERTPDARWRRTARGDALADEVLKKRK